MNLIYGIALIVLVLFTFLMTRPLGVTPDLMPTILYIALGRVGVVLLMLERREVPKRNDQQTSPAIPPWETA